MKYTLQELFEVIDERKEKEEFYYALSSIICSEKGLLNMFTGDMIVIENGKRKNFYVKDASGRLFTWDDIDKIKKHRIELFIEWC